MLKNKSHPVNAIIIQKVTSFWRENKNRLLGSNGFLLFTVIFCGIKMDYKWHLILRKGKMVITVNHDPFISTPQGKT